MVSKIVWIVVGVVLYGSAGFLLGFLGFWLGVAVRYEVHYAVTYAVTAAVTLAMGALGAWVGSHAPRSRLAKVALLGPLVPAAHVIWLYLAVLSAL